MELVYDFDLDHWTLPEARLFRTAAAGLRPEQAQMRFQKVIERVRAESEALFGDDSPPDDWMPEAVADFDPELMLAFTWIAARRENHELSLENFEAQVPYGALIGSFLNAIVAAGEAAANPLSEAPKTEEMNSSSPSSSATPPGKSGTSPTATTSAASRPRKRN
jgi:hypothetical protein